MLLTLISTISISWMAGKTGGGGGGAMIKTPLEISAVDHAIVRENFHNG